MRTLSQLINSMDADDYRREYLEELLRDVHQNRYRSAFCRVGQLICSDEFAEVFQAMCNEMAEMASRRYVPN